MSDQIDESQNHAILLLAILVALVVAGVVGLGAYKGISGAARVQPPASVPIAAVAPGEPASRIYFEIGSDALPPAASEILVKVADAARMQSDKVVLISGFHDASGDAATNAELAKQRALAVRHALEANGVAPDRLVMDKPVASTGGVDAREARRVEVRLR